MVDGRMMNCVWILVKNEIRKYAEDRCENRQTAVILIDFE